MDHCPFMALLLYNSSEIGIVETRDTEFVLFVSVAMAGISLRLLVVVFLCFSQLIIFSNAVPSARTRSLEQKSQVYGVLPANNHMANASKKWNMVKMKMRRRMDIELNDYPGSGPNNRHTPRAQVARACVDC